MITISESPILSLSGARHLFQQIVTIYALWIEISTSEIHLGELMGLIFNPTTRDKNIYLAINKRFVPYIYFFSSK